MKSPFYLRLDPADDFDFTKFIVDQANNKKGNLSGCSVSLISDPFIYFREQFIEEITKIGFSTFLKLESLNEELTTPRTPTNKIISSLIKYLENIGIDKELIIIDPYFFAPSAGTDYFTTVSEILSPFLNTLKELRIVTASNGQAFSSETKNGIESELQKISPSLEVHHSNSNNLHDRFWISNKRKKGILTGTSLNGLGKKYAIVDYIKEEDVANIVSAFEGEGLI